VTTFDQIKALSRSLYPRALAFRGPADGWREALHAGLAVSEARAYGDALAILDSVLPDNPNFTADDATDWERRLGMIPSTASLADRMAAIRRKMNHPGGIKARQHYLYIEGQLQAAGFNVWVHENRFWNGTSYDTQDPVTVFGGSGLLDNQHGDWQHGDIQHGGKWKDIIANHIDLQRDQTFSTGSSLRATFFICGQTLGTPAYIPANRLAEFRQLVLKLKPVQCVAFNFIIYL